MKRFRGFLKLMVPAAVLVASFSFCGGGGGDGGDEAAQDSPNVLGGYVYFAADDGSGGYELWRSNGIDMPDLAADINSGIGNSYPLNLTEFDGKLYFYAQTPATGGELFVYEPILDVASLAADINTETFGTSGSIPEDLTVMGGKLYFKADTPGTGSELFVYDPVLGEASLAADINSGDGSSGPYDLTELGGKLYFRAYREIPFTGVELWVYDPILEEASLAADINTDGSYHGSSSNPRDMTGLDGKLYFRADIPATGSELFVYDPVLEEASLAADIRSGDGSSTPDYLTELDGKLYFGAYIPDTGGELFVYDPVLKEASLAADINSGGNSSNPRDLTELEGKLYFSADTPATGRELFVYDPVLEEANLAADIDGGGGSSNPLPIDNEVRNYSIMGNTLFFTARNGSDGYELYTLVPGSASNQAGDMNTGGDFIYVP